MKKLLLLSTLAAISLTASAADLPLNGQEYPVDTMIVKHYVGPGTQYAYYRCPTRPLDIFVLEIDLTNPYITMEVWNGGQAAVAAEQPSSVGRRYKANGVDVVAVHNGDFYTTNLHEAGISRMGLYGAGECIFNATGNPLFIIDEDGTPWIDNVNFNGTVTRSDAASTRLHTVNQLRLEWESASHANQLSLYTPAFGSKMHMNSTGGTVAVIRPTAGSAVFTPNTKLTMEVVSVQPNPGQIDIPSDGAVLHGVGSSATFLDGVKAGETIEVYLGSSMPSYPNHKNIRDAVGGSGHIILRNGEICNINDPSLHPRTFMGISKDQKTIYSVVVDGRSAASAGIDLDDEGRLLKWLGAWDGINLDGGGSSCMVVNDDIQNHNSDGNERAVGNGVIFYSTAPKDLATASISFEPGDWRLPVGSTITPRILGFNKYGLLIDKNLTDITLSCDPEIGTVSSDGRTIIFSTKPVSGSITATTADGLSTQINVNVHQAEATATVTEYIIDNRDDYDIVLSSKIGAQNYKISSSTIDWTSADTDVATVSNGSVRGVNNGTTIITGKADHFNGSITVSTENVDGNSRYAFFGIPSSELTIKQAGGTGIKAEQFENGFALTYTGNGSARGSFIQVGNNTSGNIVTYGLPDAITLEINPGDAPVNQIAMNYIDHLGNRGTLQFTTTAVPANQLTKITLPLKNIVDVTDNSVYPLIFNSLRMTMGTSKSKTEYRIEIPRFDFVYDYEAAVENITVDSPRNDAKSNNTFDLQGRAIEGNPSPGLYIRNGQKVLINR